MDSNNIFDMASLAEASYVNWSGIDFSDVGMVNNWLTDNAKKGEFSLPQATYFSLHWEGISHRPNNWGQGQISSSVS